jgi:hypothetical protein
MPPVVAATVILAADSRADTAERRPQASQPSGLPPQGQAVAMLHATIRRLLYSQRCRTNTSQTVFAVAAAVSPVADTTVFAATMLHKAKFACCLVAILAYFSSRHYRSMAWSPGLRHNRHYR